MRSIGLCHPVLMLLLLTFAIGMPAAERADAGNPFEQLSFLAAVDGSKQPQDYGVNANLGSRLRGQLSGPLMEEIGLGYQIGSAVTFSDNAVRVFELLGEDTSRFQNHFTAGLFQRVGRFGWGGVYDQLYQDGFDKTLLGQARGRITYATSNRTTLGLTTRWRLFDDEAQFLGNPVTLRSLNQTDVFLRHWFATGTRATAWLGVNNEHSEANAAFPTDYVRDGSFVFGADIYAPLNNALAIYGETNLTTPADSGTVDAFLGLAWYPFGNARRAHRGRFRPLLPTASPTSFGVGLLP